MICDAAASFLRDVSDSEAIRSAMATERGYDSNVWRRIVEEMVWPAVLIPEEYGGLGLGWVELAVLLEQMGRALLCSPFFSTVCLGANALLLGGSAEQCHRYLPSLAAGTTTATFVGTNTGSRGEPAPDVRYASHGNSFRLSGSARGVVDGHTSDLLVVLAENDRDEQALFVVRRDAPGVGAEWLPTMDQTRRQATVSFDGVEVAAEDHLVSGSDVRAVCELLFDLARVAVSAEQLGGAQKVLEDAVAYAKERVQFGRPIGGFQAIKHKAADMMLRAEAARSAVYYAACVADQRATAGNASRALAEAASIAKAYCSDAYFFNAGTALQIFGGVGFTWEYDVHLYFKRAKASEHFLGDAAFHRDRLASMLLDDVV